MANLEYLYNSIAVLFFLFGSMSVGVCYSEVLHAVEPQRLLFLLPCYLGITIAGWVVLITEQKPVGPFRPAMLVLSLVHVTAMVAQAVALFTAGPALFQVVYSVAPIFGASMQYLALGIRSTPQQILAILLIVSGLVMRVLSAPNGPDPGDEEGATAHKDDDGDFLVGILSTCVSACLFTGSNVFTQHQLQKPPSPTPGQMLFATGTCCLAISFFLVMGVHFATRGNPFILQDHFEHVLTSNVLLSTAVLIACQACINGGFIVIVSKFGAVPVSVLGGLSTIGAVVIAHVFYCDIATNPYDDSCLNFNNTVCAMIVVVGVLGYGLAPNAPPPSRSGKIE